MNNSDSDIISYPNKLSRYSSDLIKRGLELAIEIHSDIINNTIETKNIKWEYICHITHPQNKLSSVGIDSDSYIFAIDAWGVINIWNLHTKNILHDPFIGHYKDTPKINDYRDSDLYKMILKSHQNYKMYGSSFIINYAERKK